MKLLTFTAAAALSVMTLAVPATAAVPLTPAPTTAAPLIGDTITCAATFLTCSSASATVGSGIEFTGNIAGDTPLAFDFSDGLLTISNVLGRNFSIFANTSFSFADTARGFGDATLLSSTGFGGLSQANFTLNNGALTLASPLITADRGASLTLRLGSVGAVPEPASWAMMMLGFGLMGYALRRRGTERAAVSA